MRRLKASLALIVLALGGLIAALPEPPSAASGGEVVLLATASNRGEVDPCG
jgi:hypothetical protein